MATEIRCTGNLGEMDLLRVIDEITTLYPIDPRR